MWETIDKETQRMRVPNGWIVRSRSHWGESISIHQVFVPDSLHAWELPEHEE
jgi:hypothetical protein